MPTSLQNLDREFFANGIENLSVEIHILEVRSESHFATIQSLWHVDSSHPLPSSRR